MSSISNIEEYLEVHENKDMLRFLTCGSVDDGKSTLIGRMLYDSKMIFDDQLSAIESESKKYGTTAEKLDMALLVDGLQSEREQGITIDVAYRFFATENRKFIIADTPGHEQYTRNMVTGASTADVAIILIDARKGILTQTRRHSFIVSLLGIKYIIIAINKMDLVKFSEYTFNSIKESYDTLADELNIKNRYYIPLSALDGDNVVNSSSNMPWYQGKTLLNLLDTMDISEDEEHISESNFRFPVQYVNRPNLNFRGFCGTITSGSVKVGDEITVLPSGKTTKVKSIINAGDITEKQNDKTTNIAYEKMAITITTEDEVDISRGDMIVHTSNMPRVSNSLKTMLVWMDEKAMETSKTYDIKIATTTVSGNFEHINYKVDVNTYKRIQVTSLELNDISSCKMLLTTPIAVDNYNTNRQTGSFIVVDRITSNTVGAGMIVDVSKRETETLKEENVFNIWNTKKQLIQKEIKKRSFEERDIVYIKMGKNIGFEQDGKGEDFLRPVIVYKKFNNEQFIGFALTSKKKIGKFYIEITHNNKVSYIILSQIRTYSSKRISHKIGKVSKLKMKEIFDKFTKLITP